MCVCVCVCDHCTITEDLPSTFSRKRQLFNGYGMPWQMYGIIKLFMGVVC